MKLYRKVTSTTFTRRASLHTNDKAAYVPSGRLGGGGQQGQTDRGKKTKLKFDLV